MNDRSWLEFYDEGVPHSLVYPEITLPEMLRETARKFPSATATIFGGARMTYGELQSQVEALAAGLAELGVAPGDRVAIFLPNCPQTVIAFYAVLSLGGIAVMTNPQYVERELEHQWRDAGARTVIALDRLWPRIQLVKDRVGLTNIILAGLRDLKPTEIGRGEGAVFFRELIEKGGALPDVVVKPDDAACLQYTGGTTGFAKGAVLSHRNLVVNVTQACEFIFFKAKDGEERYLAVMPFFHAYGLTAVMNVSIRKAAAMIVLPRFEIDAVMAAIREHRPTIFAGVPTMYQMMTQAENWNQADLTSLRFCTSGGAPLPVPLVQKYTQEKKIRFKQGFGMTEFGPGVFALAPEDAIQSRFDWSPKFFCGCADRG